MTTMTQSNETKHVLFEREVLTAINAGSPIIWVYLTADEATCEARLKETAAAFNYEFLHWNVNDGVSWNPRDSCKDPGQAILSIGSSDLHSDRAFVIMHDLHLLLNAQQQFSLRRVLLTECKNNTFSNADFQRPIFILADTPTPHPDIKNYCHVIDYTLPDKQEMESMVHSVLDAWAASANDTYDKNAVKPDYISTVTHGLLGLSMSQAEAAYSQAIAESGSPFELHDWTAGDGAHKKGILTHISKKRSEVIRKIEGLKFIPNEQIPDMHAFAGVDNYVSFLTKRSLCYTEIARELNVTKPRGVALLGPPGTGKTEVAKATAKYMGLDLVVFDISSMFNSHVGQSEKNMRKALATIDALHSCVLLVDEIDKSFSGALNANDSGVSSRILGLFLSWMSSRDVKSSAESRIFVVTTMNRTAGLPPELFRPGRFDRIFSTDLPNQQTREDILKIHMKKQSVDPNQYGAAIADIGKVTDKFTGGELEQLVIDSRISAFAREYAGWKNADAEDKVPAPTVESTQPTIDDYMVEAEMIIPTAVVESDAIEAMREFNAGRTTPVDSTTVLSVSKRKTSKTRRVRNVQVTNNRNSNN